jgi:GH25 family lysozyme M1 (1,4-beta-N-acetylmuramidase)
MKAGGKNMEIKGIDVSSYQEKPDWAKVKKAGINFAILRIHQKNGPDSSFEHNYRGCRTNAISIGGYKYSYALTEAQALEEAEETLAVLSGRGMDFPVFYDLEWEKQKKLGKAAVEKIAETFLNRIKKAGYKVGIYCNVDWYQNILTTKLKSYDLWLARYPANDNGTMQTRLKPTAGIGWQYSSKGKVVGISGNVDMNVFYKDYTTDENTKIDTKGENNVKLTKEQIIQNVRNDAVSFAVRIANDNSHGYSQAVRSLYNTANPKSFDCSSLVLTAYYYAFLENGLVEQANYLKRNCSYTGNMLRMLNAGFETVARNQTAHAQMIQGDIELNTTYHTALAVDKNNIVHARSSEGTKDTIDNSGNEIRTQSWYLYSHGWTHRLRFTGKGIDFSMINAAGNKPADTALTTTSKKGAGYMFEPELVKLGTTGTSVLLLQEILIARGFKGKDGKALTLSRKADENTIYALTKYQKSRNGVLEVDGECGENTWKDLIAI